MIDDLLLQCKIVAALLQWNNLTVSEQLWIKGSEQNKPHLKTEMKEVQKLLDIQVQAARRKCWRQQQEYLHIMPSYDPDAFCKHVENSE